MNSPRIFVNTHFKQTLSQKKFILGRPKQSGNHSHQPLTSDWTKYLLVGNVKYPYIFSSKDGNGTKQIPTSQLNFNIAPGTEQYDNHFPPLQGLNELAPE